MTFRISPLLGFMIGINYLDWGEEGYEDLGYRYELQIALGVLIVQIIS
tara:strand:- start:3631 stop:3774 length:144 start_codon:yes stop_codon:yes gene_type:complete